VTWFKHVPELSYAHLHAFQRDTSHTAGCPNTKHYILPACMVNVCLVQCFRYFEHCLMYSMNSKTTIHAPRSPACPLA
jgi:hypothetical protein